MTSSIDRDATSREFFLGAIELANAFLLATAKRSFP
jgi:hypothetical protein